MPTMKWHKETPRNRGYYLCAYRHKGSIRVSELWFNPDSHGTKWWSNRGYLGERYDRYFAPEVIAWMAMPVYEEQDGTQPDAASEEGGETAL